MVNDKDGMNSPAPRGDYEDLLSGEQHGNDRPAPKGAQDEKEPTIKGLKAIVLSIDWEITDQSMQAFGREIKKLKKVWSGQKVPVALLEILGALGKYIRAAKDASHPDSIKLLHSVYQNLEKVVMTPGMPEKTKRKVLSSEFKRYNELKEKLRQAKAAAAKEAPKDHFGEMMAGGAQGAEENRTEGGSVGGRAPVADLGVGKGVVPNHPENEPTPGVDGTIDELFREMINVHDASDEKSASGGGEEHAESEREVVPERDDNASFTEVDERLDEFFSETEAEEPELTFEAETDRAAGGDDVLQMEGAEGGEETLELSDTGSESAAELDERLDEFFSDAEEDGPELMQAAEAEMAVEANGALQMEESVGGEGTLNLSGSEDEAATELDERLDEFFSEAEEDDPELMQAAEAEMAVEASGALQMEEGEGGEETLELSGPESESAAELDERLDEFFSEAEEDGPELMQAAEAEMAVEADDALQMEEAEGGEETFELSGPESESAAELDERLDEFFSDAEEDGPELMQAAEAEMAVEADDALQMEEAEGGEEILELTGPESKSAAELDERLDEFFSDAEEEGPELMQAAEAEMAVEADDALQMEESVGGEETFELSGPESESAAELDERLDEFFSDAEEDGPELTLGAEAEMAAAGDVPIQTEAAGRGADIDESEAALDLHTSDTESADEIDARLDEMFGEEEDAGSGPSAMGAVDESVETIELHVENEEPAIGSIIELQAENEITPQQATAHEGSHLSGSASHGDATREKTSSIDALKIVVQSMGRGVSELNLQMFADEIMRLKNQREKEKVLLIFLHLLEALGKYIRKSGEQAHPGAMQTLLTIYGKFEQAAEAPTSDVLQHELLLEAIKTFISWKEQIVFDAAQRPAQVEDGSAQGLIILGPEAEVGILEPIGEGY